MSQIRFILFLLFFASQSLSGTTSESDKNVLNAFKTISNEDQLNIKELLQDLFKNKEFAYSLYGDKPMSFSEPLSNLSATQLLEFISLKAYCQDIFEDYVEPINVFRKRWDAWNKHKISLN
jgi:hypothetical protein